MVDDVPEQLRTSGEPSDAAEYRNAALLSIAFALLGIPMLVGAIIGGSAWGIAGACCVLAAIPFVLRADRARMEPVDTRDLRTHLSELAPITFAFSLVGLGFLLTIRPW